MVRAIQVGPDAPMVLNRNWFPVAHPPPHPPTGILKYASPVTGLIGSVSVLVVPVDGPTEETVDQATGWKTELRLEEPVGEEAEVKYVSVEQPMRLPVVAVRVHSTGWEQPVGD